ncbi:MAG: hypothetical protein ACI4DV_08965 [Lachnospiraceae bacterium]
MSFFHKLFGKSSGNENNEKKCNNDLEEMSEEEKLRALIVFIKTNAEGDDGDPECQFQYGVMYATGSMEMV